MTMQSQIHLTDEQFAELLSGSMMPEVRTHLAACARCAGEAERVGGALGDFSQQSQFWAERRAATQPVLTVSSRPAWWRVQRPEAWAATAAACAVALAAGIGVARRAEQSHVPAAAVAVVQRTEAVSPATLQADNQLLYTINGELRADDAADASVYRLKTSAHGARAGSRKGIAE